jgi:chemotaxis regulatin CheY-phosphate phosphatase CheZ
MILIGKAKICFHDYYQDLSGEIIKSIQTLVFKFKYAILAVLVT